MSTTKTQTEVMTESKDTPIGTSDSQPVDIETFVENPIQSADVLKKKKKSSTRRKKKTRRKNSKPKTKKKNQLKIPKREFPIETLERALLLPEKIKKFNQGNDWSTEDTAKAALGISKKNNKFFYTASAARDYGLTAGNRHTAKMHLEELGRKIVFAHDRKQQNDLKVQAFLSVPLFKKVFEFYNGNNLPSENEYRNNALQSEFSIPPEFHDEFTEIFEANCDFLGFERGITRTSKTPLDDTDAPMTVVGAPKGTSKTLAFVAMPFSERNTTRDDGFFNEVLTNLISPAGVGAGFVVETAKKDGSDVIHSTIIDGLINADLVIADLTDHNPNVLFELGVRIAKEKPIALIKAKGTGPVFDVDGTLRILEYNPNLWKSTLEKDVPALTDHLKGAWDGRDSERTYMSILLGGDR